MKTLLLTGAVICAGLSLFVRAAQAQFNYTDNGDGTATITGYTGPGGAVTIPTNINGLTVTTIGSAAFGGNAGLTSVSILGGIAIASPRELGPNHQPIGLGAFQNCTSLTKATMANGVTGIGDYAFDGCSALTAIVIPDSVTNIGNYSFYVCHDVTNVIIGNGVTNIGDYAFYGIGEPPYYPAPSSAVIGSSVTHIGNSAFAWVWGPFSVYFTSNAPTLGDDLVFLDKVEPEFPLNVTAYYLPGTTGWFDFNYNTGAPVLLWNAVGLVITEQPQSVTVNAHATASFSVLASDIVPTYYQWSLNGTNITGATSSSLTIANVTQTNLGTYSVAVSDGTGALTNANATLSMFPFIATSFTGEITYWGKSVDLSIQAFGTGPLSFQWYLDGAAIAGATNTSLGFAGMQFTNAGLYSVVVSNSFGSATNAPSQVIVEPAGVSLGFSPTLTINGVAGYSYIIQSAPNLTDTNAWVTLTILTLTQPVQLWVDTNVDASSPSNPKRFYRVLAGQ